MDGNRLSWPSAEATVGTKAVPNPAVTLGVAPFLRTECKFWLTDNGRNGLTAVLSKSPVITLVRFVLFWSILRLL